MRWRRKKIDCMCVCVYLLYCVPIQSLLMQNNDIEEMNGMETEKKDRGRMEHREGARVRRRAKREAERAEGEEDSWRRLGGEAERMTAPEQK